MTPVPRSTPVLHIYDRLNPKTGCFCCKQGDVVSVIAPEWARFINPAALCLDCQQVAKSTGMSFF